MCLCLYSTTLIFEPILIALCENNSMCFLRGNDSSVSPLRILTCMGRLIQPNTLAILQLVYMPRGRTNVWTAFLVYSWAERQLSKFCEILRQLPSPFLPSSFPQNQYYASKFKIYTFGWGIYLQILWNEVCNEEHIFFFGTLYMKVIAKYLLYECILEIL